MTKKSRLEELAEYYDVHDLTEGTTDDDWQLVTPEPPAAPRMVGYSVRMPAAVLDEARQIAVTRGITTGAWLREAIEAGVTREKAGSTAVPVDVLLAAVEEYRQRKAS